MNEGLRRRVVLERLHQHEKGYTAEHDDMHVNDELARAAACYAVPVWAQRSMVADNGTTVRNAVGRWVPEAWPFNPLSYTPEDQRLANVVKAIALLEAEYDRLERAGVR